MAKNRFHFAAILVLLFLVISVGRPTSAQESAADAEPYRVYVDSEGEDDDDVGRFAVDSDLETDFFFVQEGATDGTAPVSPPLLSRSEAIDARRRRSTYRLPSMFGDYFGNGIVQSNVLGTPVVIPQMIRDGVNGVDLFVTNTNGGAGADPNPAVVIQILNGGPAGAQIASSIGPGVTQGPGFVYPISDPTTTGFSPPPTNGPGTLVYDGGTANGPIGNGDGWALDFQHTFTPIQNTVLIPAGGVAVRRMKLSENNSPIPRDRFIANYNFFNDVIGGIGDVNRYAFGFEKTFLNESSSVEVLFPFASTLAADQVANGVIAKNTEFGDIPIILKTILAERDEYVLAGGIGITIPTGSDARVFNATGDQIVHVDHASVHLLPYLGLLRGYDSGWYWQSFLQLDIDTNGNRVQADLTGANLQPVGVLQEQTLLFADLGIGYQFTELGDDCRPAIAATAELHYATPLQGSDSITAGALDLRSLVNRFDVVNLTLGMNFLTQHNFSIRPAMVVPLSDDQFDYEVMVQANYWR
ncbi:MAG: hypothetical protein H6821_14780 [Planctomycetaceae bacterium]|nr:hypothetical protein [Planctomycetales bacterium]MCB9875435.1 hypothetical protein [Planctomycetaceae bacterium]MCB9938505.1 hypothetical protein [Planctomycetaceae bacterium]